jgi:hypothetical protein
MAPVAIIIIMAVLNDVRASEALARLQRGSFGFPMPR